MKANQLLLVVVRMEKVVIRVLDIVLTMANLIVFQDLM